MYGRYVAFFLIGSTLTATPTFAAVEPRPNTRQIMANASQMFILAEEMARRRDFTGAERILGLLSDDPDPDVRNEARFRHAVLLEGRGDKRAAATVLRRILDDRPNAGPVRLKLAQLLTILGEEAAARRELRALRTTDLPPTVARFVDRMAANLQASKPFGFQMEFALAPDSNINRGTRFDTLETVLGDFTLDQETRSGVGGAVRGLAQAKLPLADDLMFVARASGEANLYREKNFNAFAFDIAVGPEIRLGPTRLGAEVGIGAQWYGMKPLQRTLRLAGNVTRPLGRTAQVRVDVGLRTSDNAVNDLLDGRGFSVRARYDRAVSARTMIAASLGADRFHARDDAYSTTSWIAGAMAYRELGRTTLSLGAEVGGLTGDERLVILPKERRDRLTRIQIGAVWRQLTIAGFAPMTRIVVERNRSSIEFHDYNRTRTEFGVSRAF